MIIFSLSQFPFPLVFLAHLPGLSPLVPQPIGPRLRPLPVSGLGACPASYIPVAPVIESDCSESDFALNLLNSDCGLRLVLSPGLTGIFF